MIRVCSRAVAWVGTVPLLAACSASPAIHYYALQSITPEHQAVSLSERNPSMGGESLALGEILIPAELDRLELVTHNGPYSVRVHDDERWAAPLDDQIRHVLRDDLAAQLSPYSMTVSALGADEGQEGQLSVAILELSVRADCSVTLRAAWKLGWPKGSEVGGLESLEQDWRGPCGGSATAAVMSSVLDRLSEHLAQAISGARNTR